MKHPAPLELWREVIRPEWIDHNGHMNVAYYTLVFDHAVDAFFDYIGIGTSYRERTGGSTFAVEQHITYNREVMQGDEVRCTTRLLGFDEKRLHYYHEMHHTTAGYVAATTEFLSLHVDLSTRRVAPMPASILDRLGEIHESHRQMPVPETVGRVIKVPSLRKK